jgi:assimilatory nitrate reductase catalytic subunit
MIGVRSTCPYCGVGCGIIAKRRDDGAFSVEGDPDHPANFGKLCSKGLALAETLVTKGRLAVPSINGAQVSWDAAIAQIAERFSSAIEEHGPDSVAFYVSGQLLAEDYYVANKLMKGFIGSANIDTNSRLCMASAVAGHKRAFGADVVPCSYTDLEQADLVIIVGSNMAWCHPVLFQRLLAARDKNGTKIVVIDPRRSATAEAADLFLQIKPQNDVALFNGLLKHLYQNGYTDSQFIFAHTSGLSEALLAANSFSVEAVSQATSLPLQQIESFYRLVAQHEKTVTCFSMGVNQSASGTDKINAIINTHLVTGRISKSGAGPFSITGQPNAMGGREVGGLANMLAAHMDIDNPDHRAAVQAFWRSPRIAQKPGLKAVDLFRAVHDGRIKALWIMGTNPAVSMPDAGFVAEALKRCPFVVVSDVMAETETTQYADVLLPAQGWGEKNGTVTNTERVISRQRDFVEAQGEARADWRIICDVAIVMGFDGFAFHSPAEIFAEHVALTQVANNNSRKLDLSDWNTADYDTLKPKQWGGTHPFADGKFQTASGRAQFVPTQWQPTTDTKVILNTGRIRDQWHTMTRTGLVPRLFSHRAEPHIEISPRDAKRLDIAPASLAAIEGPNGTSILRALVTDAVKPGEAFQPMHWSSTHASSGLANIYAPTPSDPVSGQPALKSVSVSLKPYRATWYGFGLSLNDAMPQAAYRAHRPLSSGIAFECADELRPEDWMTWLSLSIGEGGEVSSLRGSDPTSFRCVVMRDERLAFAFFASASPVQVSRSWLESLLGKPTNPFAVMAGRPSAPGEDQGAILCACMGVGSNRLSRYIAGTPGASLEQVCRETSAGTGCGSCRAEIRRMMDENAKHLEAAE